jgi:hypothetical protein
MKVKMRPIWWCFNFWNLIYIKYCCWNCQIWYKMIWNEKNYIILNINELSDWTILQMIPWCCWIWMNENIFKKLNNCRELQKMNSLHNKYLNQDWSLCDILYFLFPVNIIITHLTLLWTQIFQTIFEKGNTGIVYHKISNENWSKKKEGNFLYSLYFFHEWEKNYLN